MQERDDRERMLRGEGRFSDDLALPGLLHAVFVRSPHAHARIAEVETADARAAPDVVAVLGAADMLRAGVRNVSVPQMLTGRDGAKLIVPHRPALAGDRVLHVGQPIALVVAETRSAAEDAAERVAITFEELPAITDTRAAGRPDAPQVWPEAPGNLAIDWPGPVPETNADVEAALDSAPHRVRIEVIHQRLAGAPLEPRGATARFDADGGTYVLHCGSQGAHALSGQLSAVLGASGDAIRVLTDDVGGSFGLKTHAYPEYAALLVAARRLARPVRWVSTRSEAFLSDNQGRDTITIAELGLGRDGRFVALKISATTAMGAFLSAAGAHIACNNFARCFPSVYAIPRVAVSVACVFTNTVPTGPYRGAGRPEANYVLERLVDEAARQIGFDRIALRRRNLVPESAMPFATAVGNTYDGGAFEAILDEALAASGYATFEARRADAARRGRLRGIGVSCFLEHAGGSATEGTTFAFPEPGRIEIGLGVQSSGQSHRAVFTKLAADRLGIPVEQVAIAQGDSDIGVTGGPTVASRSAMTAGTAIVAGVDALIAKARSLAAVILAVPETDIVYRDGTLLAAGTNRTLSLFDLAEEARARVGAGDWSESLETTTSIAVPQSFPNGCHVAEIEIDPDTGHAAVVDYTAIDDCGLVLDHAVAEGQVVGGFAQGLGQALLEQVVYDPGSGQIVTGSFTDYAMPRAADMPPMRSLFHPVACRTNPLGTKGIGEAGTTAALAAIMNAIADAIPAGRGAALQMPATAEKIWRACNGA